MDAARKPTFRPAQIISEAEGDAEIESGDPERMRLALIDGSRCLADEWTMNHAPSLLDHPDSGVRWAAVFALDQARSTWVPALRDDFQFIFELERLAEHDPDPHVRGMTMTLFVDMVALLLNSSTK